MGNPHRHNPISVLGTVVGGMQPPSINWGVQTTTPVVDGNIAPEVGAISRSEPTISFSTHELAAVLALCGVTPTAGTVITYNRKIDAAGTPTASTAHESYTMTTALAVLQSLSCSSGGNAAASYMCHGYHATAGTPPLKKSTTVALPSYSATPVLFGLGKVVVNGTQITGIQSVSVNLGIGVDKPDTDGNIYPTTCKAISYNPTISFTYREPDQATAMSGTSPNLISGTAIASTTCLYFRKRTMDGLYVADATAEHVKVTMNAGIITVQSEDGDPRTVSVTITCRATNGGSGPLTISAASAIS